MKPFDFNQFAAGAPALMPDGRKVTFVHFATNPTNISYPVVVHIEGAEALTSISVDGKMPFGKGHDTQLTMAPVKRTVWVNLYKDGACYHYPNKEQAERHPEGYTKPDLAIAVPIEIED